MCKKIEIDLIIIAKCIIQINKVKMTTNFKILILGDGGVGKTNFITMQSRNEFNRHYNPTFGVENTDILYKDITVTVSEFAGQEKYGFTKNVCDEIKPDAVILMYDCSSKLSYKNILDWYDRVSSVKHVPMVLIGNKSDISHIKFDISKLSVALSNEITNQNFKYFKYFEVSTKNNTNVREVFDYLYS